MGCCESTPIATTTKPTNPYASPPTTSTSISNTAAAPPPLEEETVKEVLSETPISKPQITKPTNTQSHLQVTNIDPIDVTKHSQEEQVEEINIVSEISEASEFCSFSGSFSTNTVNEKDDGEVTQRLVSPSPAKTPRKCTNSGDQKRRNTRSPARVPAPAKRGPPARSRVGQARTNSTPHRRNVGPGNGARRDSVDVSLRRSRSPAPRGGSGQKTATSSIVTGQSGCKSPVKKAEEGKNMEHQNDGALVENSNESLENPLVSLECFIFL